LLTELSAQTVRTLDAIQGLPLLWGWIVVMATNPLAHSLLRQAIWRVLAVFVCGLLVEFGIRRLFRRPVLILEARSPITDSSPPPVEETAEELAEAGETEPPRPRRLAAVVLLRRLPLVFLRLLLDLLPVIGFAIAGHIVAATAIGGSDQTRLIILAMVDAYAACSAIICFARMMLSPESARLRLVPISNATALWATVWIRRLTVVGIFGYAIAEVGLLLGMSNPAHDGVLKLAALIIELSLAVMVLQKRRAVKRRIRARAGAVGPMARMRNAIAPIWHWMALFFLAALWFIYALELRNGFATLMHFFLALVVVMVAVRLVGIVLLGSIDRMLRVDAELAERYPGLDARLQAYHPVLHGLIRGLLYVGAAILLLEFWGVPLLAWFADSFLGRRLAAGLGTMALTIVLALVVWEGANGAMQLHLAHLTQEQQLARSARLRTLLPLLRSTLFVVILVIAGLTVLSEIGLNIGPLLAGAGIIGVAIGFGSQKLVQDLITGVFLLLENAMQVGDWVTVSGLSGTVENLTVRTIRLRAADGSVHIIPFSAVTSVTNTNRGIGNAPVNISLSYMEDTDRVGAVLAEIVAGMRKEPQYAMMMLSGLELWGVDKVDGASVTLTGQIQCTDAGRWPVQREFNRRVKIRFQELGISIWNPAQTFVVPAGPGAPARAALTGPREAAAE
jgi:small-conductance mechanosensitive channel